MDKFVLLFMGVAVIFALSSLIYATVDFVREIRDEDYYE